MIISGLLKTVQNCLQFLQLVSVADDPHKKLFLGFNHLSALLFFSQLFKKVLFPI